MSQASRELLVHGRIHARRDPARGPGGRTGPLGRRNLVRGHQRQDALASVAAFAAVPGEDLGLLGAFQHGVLVRDLQGIVGAPLAANPGKAMTNHNDVIISPGDDTRQDPSRER